MSESGYDIEKEDRKFLRALPEFETSFDVYCETRLDPRELVKVENQRNQGACAGHSLSSIVEWCYTIATHGTVEQLSRAMAYYETQRLDGIRGDRGSTISGGVKLARETGICREELWPYPSSYNPARPSNFENVLLDASKRKIKSAVQFKTYEAARAFLGSNQGGIHCGIMWGNGMNKAIVENYSPGGGGHAIAALCLSERTDARGRPYFWIINSWSESFGSREHPGWHEWSPNAFEQMLRANWSEFVGLSDLDKPTPRKLNLDDWKKGLKV